MWRIRLQSCARRLALVLAVVLCVGVSGCGGGGVFFGKVYEYEEDVYLALDGSAQLIVNASIPALVALRGMDLNMSRSAVVDRPEIRSVYESAVADITRISRPWRRHGRAYVQIRMQVADIRRLNEARPFAWSSYELTERDGQYVYRQVVGPSALKPGTLQNVGWTGGELVAFRLHLPSKILYHNARDLETNNPSEIQRGNILAWEQPLADRLDGRPITIEVRLDQQTILYQTLYLFAGAFLAAVALIGLVLWLTVRKGRRQAVEAGPTAPA